MSRVIGIEVVHKIAEHLDSPKWNETKISFLIGHWTAILKTEPLLLSTYEKLKPSTSIRHSTYNFPLPKYSSPIILASIIPLSSSITLLPKPTCITWIKLVQTFYTTHMNIPSFLLKTMLPSVAIILSSVIHLVLETFPPSVEETTHLTYASTTFPQRLFLIGLNQNNWPVKGLAEGSSLANIQLCVAGTRLVKLMFASRKPFIRQMIW